MAVTNHQKLFGNFFKRFSEAFRQQDPGAPVSYYRHEQGFPCVWRCLIDSSILSGKVAWKKFIGVP